MFNEDNSLFPWAKKDLALQKTIDVISSRICVMVQTVKSTY